MKVKILKPCYVDGVACEVGKVVETTHGNLLIGTGKAEKAVETATPKKVKKTAVKDSGNREADKQHER